jgi:hypothetical protein
MRAVKQREEIMRGYRVRSFPLILSALFLMSCTKTKYACPGAVEIDIAMSGATSCQASPDIQKVKDTCQVFWKSTDSNSYTVHFKKFDPIGADVGVGPGPNTPRVANGDSWCKNLHVNCKYPYSITKQGDNNPCQDPKVHIDPTG